MPICEIDSNAAFPAGFTAETTQVLADALGKPPAYVMVICRNNANMSMGGTEDPCAFVRINSIGAVGKDVNGKHAAAITAHVSKQLKVEAGRIFIEFVDLPAYTVGLGGNTFG